MLKNVFQAPILRGIFRNDILGFNRNFAGPCNPEVDDCAEKYQKPPYCGPVDYTRSSCSNLGRRPGTFPITVEPDPLKPKPAISISCFDPNSTPPPRPKQVERPYCVNINPVIKNIKEISDCRKPIQFNPCAPPAVSPYNPRKYKYFFFFIAFPVIFAKSLDTFGQDDAERRIPCRHYEYMRRRTKRFPWGEGKKSFFHNDHVNILDEECEDITLASECETS